MMPVATSVSVRKEADGHSANTPRSLVSNSFFSRWYIYQRERFPLLSHGPLVLAFSLSALCFSTLLRGGQNWPAWPTITVAFLNSLFFFLQLRLADEFKDFE